MIADISPINYVMSENPTPSISYTFVCLHLDTTRTYIRQYIKKKNKKKLTDLSLKSVNTAENVLFVILQISNKMLK